MTDTIESLRAKLAEVEGALREAMATIPSRWGPPDVLAHLLRRAGERDQAVIRAEAAEAACAEMRAALEEIVKRGNEQRGTGRMIETAEAALARTDLGRGMVAVPRETLERVRKALGSHETCGVDCYMAAVADLDALLDGGKGRG